MLPIQMHMYGFPPEKYTNHFTLSGSGKGLYDRILHVHCFKKESIHIYQLYRCSRERLAGMVRNGDYVIWLIETDRVTDGAVVNLINCQIFSNQHVQRRGDGNRTRNKRLDDRWHM